VDTRNWLKAHAAAAEALVYVWRSFLPFMLPKSLGKWVHHFQLALLYGSKLSLLDACRITSVQAQWNRISPLQQSPVSRAQLAIGSYTGVMAAPTASSCNLSPKIQLDGPVLLSAHRSAAAPHGPRGTGRRGGVPQSIEPDTAATGLF
jgi:hypothetical protein